VSSITHYNWQRHPGGPTSPYTRCSPNLTLISAYIRQQWGGQNLGCYNPRPIAGTNIWSSHAYGAATDVGIGERHGGPGTSRANLEILPWLTANHETLGIQQIHAYWRASFRIWRCDRGWYDGNPGRGNDWIHIEVNPTTWHWSTQIADRLTVLKGAKVERLNGSNRYHTAVLMSQRHYPKGAASVYVASGSNFPDALAASVATDGPVLLTDTNTLPPVVRDEIVRLRPKNIVIVGGPAAVSPNVETQLRQLTGS
jgi:hypothetical protein